MYFNTLQQYLSYDIKNPPHAYACEGRNGSRYHLRFSISCLKIILVQAIVFQRPGNRCYLLYPFPERYRNLLHPLTGMRRNLLLINFRDPVPKSLPHPACRTAFQPLSHPLCCYCEYVLLFVLTFDNENIINKNQEIVKGGVTNSVLSDSLFRGRKCLHKIIRQIPLMMMIIIQSNRTLQFISAESFGSTSFDIKQTLINILHFRKNHSVM